MADNDDILLKIRHSAAHVMAEAVIQIFPTAKIAIGPAIENGFYYDFDLPRTLTPEDLEEIEKLMKAVIKGKHTFTRQVVSRKEAEAMFKDQPYKLELIAELPEGEEISIYTQGAFTDLCRGPHVANTGEIDPAGVKLLSISSAYWRGDEKREQLQRIYGTAWRNKKELDAHLTMLEEAKKRDHRKLGRDLEIFFFDDEIGPGLPLWMPKGGVIIEELEKLAKEMEAAAGYERVKTPHLTKESLFLKSGHLPYYAESMYPPMELEGTTYYIKPMNCPFHHKIFGCRTRSYRELPLRLAEYGTCYRYEKSGELFGLMRVRSMQMNDAHIYCAEDQFETEFMAVIDMYNAYFKLFGIEKFLMRFSTHGKEGLGKKYVDNEALWLKTEDMVRKVMTKSGIPFTEVADEAAFYGPKIDVQIWSAIGREFTLATNQVDFAVPERFNLKFMNKAGTEETPLCLHRAPLSTHERMIGFLLEHFAGALPVWLSPVQVAVIPVAEPFNGYVAEIEAMLKTKGIRARADLSSDRFNAKIRLAQAEKIPYMMIAGEQEQTKKTVSVRLRTGEQLKDLAQSAFADLVKGKITSRSLSLQ
ncbi:MAG: threonine--tRNA ligase [Spirochaetales bacterium]|nr:threonine--tRNA ligase [Spirochaetales bacterium]